MDQIKIGKFIAEMRKEQNLTQMDLAEKLGVSNKTISKWECGNGMPDYALIQRLCEILSVNVNEILSGERLPSEDYSKKAEENIMNLIQESDNNDKREKREFIGMALGILSIILIFFFIAISFGGISAVSNYIDMPFLIYISAVIIITLLTSGKLKDFLKAFSLAINNKVEDNYVQLQKSKQAIKIAIVTANIGGVLAVLVGLIESFRAYVSVDKAETAIFTWVAWSLITMCYSLLFTLILIPIYVRIKEKILLIRD